MFENLKSTKNAFIAQEFPDLHFNGEMKHPLNIVVLPVVVVGVSIIFCVFIIMATVIDLCNLFVQNKRYRNGD